MGLSPCLLHRDRQGKLWIRKGARMPESSPLNHTRDRRNAARVSLVAPIPQLCLPSGPFANLSEETWQRTRAQSRAGVSTQFGDLATNWSSGSVGYPLARPRCSARGPPPCARFGGGGTDTHPEGVEAVGLAIAMPV